jgi:hypothetical protein
MTKPRDYKAEYARYHSTPEHIAERSERNKARRLMAKKVGKSAIAGKDIDHERPIRSGGGNSASNLRVRSVHANRGWEDDSAKPKKR